MIRGFSRFFFLALGFAFYFALSIASGTPYLVMLYVVVAVFYEVLLRRETLAISEQRWTDISIRKLCVTQALLVVVVLSVFTLYDYAVFGIPRLVAWHHLFLIAGAVEILFVGVYVRMRRQQRVPKTE